LKASGGGESKGGGGETGGKSTMMGLMAD